MTQARWLLVEHCGVACNWLHRLYLTPEGQPFLDRQQHPEKYRLTLRAMATQITLTRLGQERPPACLVVAVWLGQHEDLARQWGAQLYQEGNMVWHYGKHVRLCVRCEEPIPALMTGHGAGAYFCGGACRTHARQTGKTVDHLRRARLIAQGHGSYRETR